jgi:hypothetical protein
MAQKCCMTDMHSDIVSLYGTADAGVICGETPFSVRIRRWLAAHPESVAALFGRYQLPTLLQYNPFARYIEQHPKDGERGVRKRMGMGCADICARDKWASVPCTSHVPAANLSTCYPHTYIPALPPRLAQTLL